MNAAANPVAPPPAASPSTPNSSPAVAAPAPPEEAVVLLVDDQLIIGEAVRRILAPQPGIRFHYCQKGQEALAAAERLKPTVILQDLVMPDADGLDLVRAYRQQDATRLTPLIVLSSKEEGATKAEAFARGANDYVVKLPDPVELVARVRYHSRGYLSLLQRNEAFEALRQSQAALAAELAQAADYVRTLLPQPMRGAVQIDWRFVPSASLGGDCFDYFWIDDDHLAIYLLDVCGHGVGPALLGVSAMNAVRGGGVGGVDLRVPSGVLTRMNELFQMEHHRGMYFTMWYGVYRPSTRTLAFTGAGHPPPLLMGPLHGATTIREVESRHVPVGIMPDGEFETATIDVPAGSGFLLYSDGAIEVFREPRKLWGVAGLTEFMRARDTSDPRVLDELHTIVQGMTGAPTLADDFSAILARFP